MHWTQSLSAAKVSYLLGSMSSFVTPLGRVASGGGVLLSSSSVALFFGAVSEGSPPLKIALGLRLHHF